jgi:hypothetical protein
VNIGWVQACKRDAFATALQVAEPTDATDDSAQDTRSARMAAATPTRTGGSAGRDEVVRKKVPASSTARCVTGVNNTKQVRLVS